MRYAAILGGLLAAVMGGVGHQSFALAPSALTLAPLDRGYVGAGGAGRCAKAQRHTGAGGRGMHRHWKSVRASGRR